MTDATRSTLSEMLAIGGPVMWILLALSVAALALILERAIALKRARIDLGPFVDELSRALVSRGSVADALTHARAHRGPVAAMVRAGLDRVARGKRQPEVIEKALESAALVQIRRLRRGLPALATIAVAAPLLGFLGTVTGMIASFDALVEAGMSNPALVALGIKEALYTTAGGLAVAIPVQVAYNVFSTKIEGLAQDLEEVGGAVLEMVGEMSR